MTSARLTKTKQPASFFDDAFISQGLQPPQDPRPFSERDSVIRTPVGTDFANQPNDVATLGRNLAVLGYVPFDDPSVQGAFTPALEKGVRAVQKKEQKTNTNFKVDGQASVKTQDVIQKRLQAHAAERASGVLPPVAPLPKAAVPKLPAQPAAPSQISAINPAAKPQPGRMLALVRNAEAAAAKRSVAVTESKADQPTYADEIDPADIAARIWDAKPADRADAEADAARHLPRHHEDRRAIRRAAEQAALAAEFDYPPHAPTVAAGADAAQAAAAEIQTEGAAFRDGTNGAYRMGLAESGETTIYDAEGAEALTLPTDEARLVGEYAIKTDGTALSNAAVRPLTVLMEGMLEDRAAGKRIDIRDAAPLGRQVANILAEAAPGLGEARSARDAEIAGALALEAYENDELRDFLIYSVQTGVAGIGAIPLLGAVVRVPKKAIEAVVMVLSRAGKGKPPKFADAAKKGRIPDGMEVTLQSDADLPSVTLKFDGDAPVERLRFLDAARDHIARDDVKAAIYDLIDGGVVGSATTWKNQANRNVLNITKTGGEDAAEVAFNKIAQQFGMKSRQTRNGSRTITVPNIGPNDEDLTISYHLSTERYGPSVSPQVEVPRRIALELGLKANSTKIKLKIRFPGE